MHRSPCRLAAALIALLAFPTFAVASWSTPADLAPPSLRIEDAYPRTAAAGDTVAAIWMEGEGVTRAVQLQVDRRGDRRPPVEVVAPSHVDPSTQRVAVGADGTVAVAWRDVAHGLWARIVAPDGTMSAPHQIDAEGWAPRVVVHGPGRATVVYMRASGGVDSVRAVRVSAAGPEPGIPLSAPNSLEVGIPDVVAAANGDSVAAAWRFRLSNLPGGGQRWLVQAAVIGPDGFTAGAVDLSRDDYNSGVPALSASADGFRAAWSEAVPAASQQDRSVWSPTFDGAGSASAVQVAPVGQEQSWVAVISGADGGALVAHSAYDGHYAVRLQFQRCEVGVRRGRTCVAVRPGARRVAGRACVRWVTVGTLTPSARPGPNRVVITRLRVGRRTLSPGIHRIQATLRAADGRLSPVRTLAVRVRSGS